MNLDLQLASMLAPSRYTILKLIQVLCTLISNLDLLDLEFQQLKLERSKTAEKGKARSRGKEGAKGRGGDGKRDFALLKTMVA